MKEKNKKVIALIGIALSCSSLMAGCSAYDSDNDTSASDSEKILSDNDKTYKLAYFEARAIDDIKHQYYSLGFYKDGKLEKVNLQSNTDRYQEIIVPNLENPYVKVTNGGYLIYRSPYTMYNQPIVKGKVTEKE
ncbi:hypothetical protein [Lactobacillus hominis]|uniref:hypothetical protein n=1 Tax=Lactobacillus hominis TaxID=1203033 RepID=UPI00261C97F1|nr:hypothetical protein [Lactobacillus hominis]